MPSADCQGPARPLSNLLQCSGPQPQPLNLVVKSSPVGVQVECANVALDLLLQCWQVLRLQRPAGQQLSHKLSITLVLLA